MLSRIDLHEKLEEILGSKNIYFQPPATVQMKYPAIVYSRRNIKVDYADGLNYILSPCYEIVLIDKNPESEFIEKLIALPYCSYDRHYESDNLNHDVFTIYQN